MKEERSLGSQDLPQRKKKMRFSIPYIGIFCGLLAGFFFSLSIVCAKVTTVSPLYLGAFQSSVRYFIVLPVVFYTSNHKMILGPPGGRVFLWLQGFVLSLSAFFSFLALKELSVGNTVTLSFLEVLFAPILARIFLKESLTVLDCVFALLCLSGVVFIAKPPFIFSYLPHSQSESVIGVIYGIIAPFLASTSFVLIRKIGQDVHFLNMVLTNLVGGVFMGSMLVYASGTFEFPCHMELLFLTLVAVFTLLAQIALVFSLKHERPGTVTILMTPQIIIVYLFQVLVLHDIPSVLSVIGSALIFTTSICVGIRKIVNERRHQQPLVEEEVN